MSALIELVTRLRRVGIQISDRRAVRLQRIIAASAILASRTTAAVSDLWTVQYIWDTPAQQEILQAQVARIREQFESSETNEWKQHPMADRASPPSPEKLQEELETLQSVESSESAQDELTLLATQIEWIENETAQQHLRDAVQSLREKWLAH